MRFAFLAAALFLSAPASAQENVDPSPPLSIEDATVSAWIDQHLDVEGWQVVGADEVAVALVRTGALSHTPQGFPIADVRHEYYRASDFGGQSVRSNLQVRVFDCAQSRQQISAMAIYRHNNLRDNYGLRQFSGAEWTSGEPRSLKARTIAAVCQASVAPSQ